jgi:hypothetical protein
LFAYIGTLCSKSATVAYFTVVCTTLSCLSKRSIILAVLRSSHAIFDGKSTRGKSLEVAARLAFNAILKAALRILNNQPTDEEIIEEQQERIESLEKSVRWLENQIDEMRKAILEQVNYVEDWYPKIARHAHPDRGGDEKVMQMINELKERADRLMERFTEDDE